MAKYVHSNELCGVRGCSTWCRRDLQKWARFLHKGLDELAFERLCAAASSRVFSRGDVIFDQGSVCDGFYLVVKGRVSLEPPKDLESLVAAMRRRSLGRGGSHSFPVCDHLFNHRDKVDLSPGDVFGALSFLSHRWNVFRGTQMPCRTFVGHMWAHNCMRCGSRVRNVGVLVVFPAVRDLARPQECTVPQCGRSH